MTSRNRIKTHGKRAVRIADLPSSDHAACLLCPCCFAKFSATRGDYFLHDPTEPMKCSGCGVGLLLVTERTVFEEVRR